MQYAKKIMEISVISPLLMKIMHLTFVIEQCIMLIETVSKFRLPKKFTEEKK